MSILNIYIASSWKNQHAVWMLTTKLRELGYAVSSFVENNNGEWDKGGSFDDWVWSDKGLQSFNFDTEAATTSDLVIYIGPSGVDAWAEVGAAWASGVTVFGLVAKGEQVGLMRRMVTWFESVDALLEAVQGKQKRSA